MKRIVVWCAIVGALCVAVATVARWDDLYALFYPESRLWGKWEGEYELASDGATDDERADRTLVAVVNDEMERLFDSFSSVEVEFDRGGDVTFTLVPFVSESRDFASSFTSTEQRRMIGGLTNTKISLRSAYHLDGRSLTVNVTDKYRPAYSVRFGADYDELRLVRGRETLVLRRSTVDESGG